jgi:hypothetical protein
MPYKDSREREGAYCCDPIGRGQPLSLGRDDHFTIQGVLSRSEKRAGVMKVVKKGGESRVILKV